eukprot:31769-Eustigmatos_ZCMA.PRE.1
MVICLFCAYTVRRRTRTPPASEMAKRSQMIVEEGTLYYISLMYAPYSRAVAAVETGAPGHGAGARTGRDTGHGAGV